MIQIILMYLKSNKSRPLCIDYVYGPLTLSIRFRYMLCGITDVTLANLWRSSAARIMMVTVGGFDSFEPGTGGGYDDDSMIGA